MLDEGLLACPSTVLVLVASPSRERVEQYRLLRDEVEVTVGRINGEHAELGNPPVHYLHQSYPREEMAALYLAADVMLVTSLRDGMNLVAKEYVACRCDETGALVLSEFTGAADELSGAFLVNPHDIEGMKETIVRAATVSPGRGQAPDARRCAAGSASTTWPTGRRASCAPWTRAGRAALLRKREPRPRGLIMGAGAQVLVVGAGPSGLLAAVELARHGVAVRLVEREPEPHHQARATAIQPGTLEILAQAGLAGTIPRCRGARAASPGFWIEKLDGRSARARSRVRAATGRSSAACRSGRPSSSSPARLAELGGTVERGVSVVSLEPHDAACWPGSSTPAAAPS